MMQTAQEALEQWRGTRGQSAAHVALLRVDDGAVVLSFSRPSAAAFATVSLAPVEGLSFFAEGLDDPPEEVEEWLTEVNSYLSEKPRVSLPEALDALVARAPALDSLSKDDERVCDDEEEEEEDAAALVHVEAAEERSAKRAAISEDRRWDAVVASSASKGSRQASQVLMREVRALLALSGDGSSKAMEVDMVGDSLYHWCVKMHANGFPDDSVFKSELRRFASEHPSAEAAVVMDVLFPDDYPMSPPFIRVVRPRFQMHTGHITVGGSICMQLLTPSGWLPSVSLENVFVSIRSEMIEGGGRIDFSARNRDYSLSEAREAFNRVAARYGWLAR